MVDPLHFLSSFQTPLVLVAGDMMLDHYTVGSAMRISPEAPVPVVEVESETKRLGGAGNVMRNLSSLGASVRALSFIGDDSAGATVLSLSEELGIDTRNIFQDGGKTTIKHRLIAGRQQIARFDIESKREPSSEILSHITKHIDSILDGIDIVALSDYGKGCLSPALTHLLLSEAKRRNIETIVDPKGLDFSKYSGCGIIKPNEMEAYMAASMPRGSPLEKVAKILLEKTKSKHLMITRAEKGISLYNKDHEKHYPVKIKEVRDVTGAGDTVLATLAFCLANKATIDEAVPLCNAAASVVIERFGACSISLQELKEVP